MEYVKVYQNGRMQRTANASTNRQITKSYSENPFSFFLLSMCPPPSIDSLLPHHIGQFVRTYDQNETNYRFE